MSVHQRAHVGVRGTQFLPVGDVADVQRVEVSVEGVFVRAQKRLDPIDLLRQPRGCARRAVAEGVLGKGACGRHRTRARVRLERCSGGDGRAGGLQRTRPVVRIEGGEVARLAEPAAGERQDVGVHDGGDRGRLTADEAVHGGDEADAGGVLAREVTGLDQLVEDLIGDRVDRVDASDEPARDIRWYLDDVEQAGQPGSGVVRDAAEDGIEIVAESARNEVAVKRLDESGAQRADGHRAKCFPGLRLPDATPPVERR